MVRCRRVDLASRTVERCRTTTKKLMTHTVKLWAMCRCNCDTCQRRVAFLKFFDSVFLCCVLNSSQLRRLVTASRVSVCRNHKKSTVKIISSLLCVNVTEEARRGGHDNRISSI